MPDHAVDPAHAPAVLPDVTDQDRATQQLPATHTILLHCLRTLDAAWGSPGRHEAAGTVVSESLARLDAGAASPFLENFMTALRHGARRAIGLRAPGQLRVAPDERILLGILAFAQENRPAEALLLLRGLVRPDGARLVLRNAEGLATELALSGRYIAAADLALPPVAAARTTLPRTTFH